MLLFHLLNSCYPVGFALLPLSSSLKHEAEFLLNFGTIKNVLTSTRSLLLGVSFLLFLNKAEEHLGIYYIPCTGFLPILNFKMYLQISIKLL